MYKETSKVRAYGFGELAQLYFPNITKKSASAQMRRWITGNTAIIAKLQMLGYKAGNRLLTPVHVKIIVDEFGEP